MSLTRVELDMESERLKATKFYDKIAKNYFGESISSIASVTSYMRMMRCDYAFKLFKEHLKSSSVVADIGCGPALLCRKIKQDGHEYIGLDISKNMIDKALKMHPECRFMLGRIEEIPLESESVDCVIALGVIEYLSDPYRKKAFNEMYRIVTKGGIVIISGPNLWNYITFTRWLLQPLMRLLYRLIIRSQDSKKVFFSDIVGKSFFPEKLRKEANEAGFYCLDQKFHNYCPFAWFNYGLSSGLIRIYNFFERVVPLIGLNKTGSNYILCLRK